MLHWGLSTEPSHPATEMDPTPKTPHLLLSKFACDPRAFWTIDHQPTSLNMKGGLFSQGPPQTATGNQHQSSALKSLFPERILWPYCGHRGMSSASPVVREHDRWCLAWEDLDVFSTFDWTWAQQASDLSWYEVLFYSWTKTELPWLEAFLLSTSSLLS